MGACTPQPELPSVFTSQLLFVGVPVMVRLAGIAQFAPVWSVMAFGDWSFTPSTLLCRSETGINSK